jgi:hypothetical protein
MPTASAKPQLTRNSEATTYFRSRPLLRQLQKAAPNFHRSGEQIAARDANRRMPAEQKERTHAERQGPASQLRSRAVPLLSRCD